MGAAWTDSDSPSRHDNAVSNLLIEINESIARQDRRDRWLHGLSWKFVGQVAGAVLIVGALLFIAASVVVGAVEIISRVF